MIVFPILLALFSWLLLLRLCNQHKHINIFEQIVLWFVSALSLFVFELFLQGVIFGHLSLVFPIVTFVVLLWLFIYKTTKHTGYLKEILDSIKHTFLDIGQQFASMKSRKKYLLLAIAVYALVKVFMVFSINTHMPTFDEDAVAGRDIKAKIFASNQSLVLDKASPDYFGSDYGRYPFAWITDTYFLLPYGGFVNGLGNIIEPLLYLFSLLLLLGIFLRKTNLFVAAVSWYVFTSLPFVFIHGFGSYRNFPAWVLLFVFAFYLIDQLLHIEDDHAKNIWMLCPLVCVWFLSGVIRNEWVMLTWIVAIAAIFLYHLFKKDRKKELRYQWRVLVPVVVWYVLNKIIFSFYPAWTVLNAWGVVNANLINAFFTNIGQPGVFVAPFQQMFYHSDYILLFILFVITLILFSVQYKKMKNMRIILAVTLLLIVVFMFILYSNVQLLWLLTHFAFIRYPVSIVLFLIYTIISIIYLWQKNYEHWL